MSVTEKRRDLARELQHDGTRRAYLHPKRLPLLALLWRMYEPVRESPRMIAAHLAYAISFGVLPLLGVIATWMMVRLLSQPDARTATLLWAAAIYGLVFVLCGAASKLIYHRHYSWFTKERLRLLRLTNYKLMRMDFGLFESSRFMDDVQTAYASFSGNNNGVEGTFHKVFELGGTLVAALLLAGLLSWLSPLLALLGLAFVALSTWAKIHVGRLWHEKREEMMRVFRRLSMLSQEAADFKAGKDLRLYGMAGRFRAVFEPVMRLHMAMHRTYTKRELKLSFLENLALVAVDVAGALLLITRRTQGSITMADFVMLLSALVLFSQTLLALAQQLAFIKTETRYVQDAFDVLDARLDSAGGIDYVPGEGPVRIEFEDVSFAYPGTDKKVLEHLSFEIQSGERCALVGVNGAGKTTLVKLLIGLYQPDAGRILIDGIDSTTLSQQALFALFGVVFQEVEPIALSIAETVAASTQGIDRLRVEQALRTAGLWDKVDSYEKGIDTPLLKIIHEEGVILSGGEKQKLMIARALYKKNTRMMVLDEPTAALDALAEQAVYLQFDQLLSGRSALFVSHRLASTRFCDRILLLNGGRIAQHGSHEQLLAQEGLYRQLFTTQGKYYQEQEGEA